MGIIDKKMYEEARAFDRQILERIANGHLPDLRRAGRCEYFYNNVWRDQSFVELYFGEVVDKAIAALKKFIKKAESPRLLEVGCGPGHVCLELARNGINVTGIDLSAECIRVAQSVAEDDPWKAERALLLYRQEDIFGVNEEFDAVLFVASLHHFTDIDAVLKHVASLLVPDGLIIADEPCRDLVSRKNLAVIGLIKLLLSESGSYYKNLELPKDDKGLEQFLDELFRQERYEEPDGTKVQSINDNESSFAKMVPSLRSKFEELCFEKNYAMFHQLVGGIRLDNPAQERAMARCLKILDVALCRYGALDPVNFYYVGKKRE
jgi:2-polyprenyl-6-hydroxyphenyl methylase/3-demethylubiquinone-9 3-methyltransferase